VERSRNVDLDSSCTRGTWQFPQQLHVRGVQSLAFDALVHNSSYASSVSLVSRGKFVQHDALRRFGRLHGGLDRICTTMCPAFDILEEKVGEPMAA
jgi:hypothetical protein